MILLRFCYFLNLISCFNSDDSIYFNHFFILTIQRSTSLCLSFNVDLLFSDDLYWHLFFYNFFDNILNINYFLQEDLLRYLNEYEFLYLSDDLDLFDYLLRNLSYTLNINWFLYLSNYLLNYVDCLNSLYWHLYKYFNCFNHFNLFDELNRNLLDNLYCHLFYLLNDNLFYYLYLNRHFFYYLNLSYNRERYLFDLFNKSLFCLYYWNLNIVNDRIWVINKLLQDLDRRIRSIFCNFVIFNFNFRSMQRWR